eukprot:16451370-Heterocapsa_arctica.AAC.1
MEARIVTGERRKKGDPGVSNVGNMQNEARRRREEQNAANRGTQGQDGMDESEGWTVTVGASSSKGAASIGSEAGIVDHG